MYLEEEESLLLQMYTFVPVKNTMTYQENEEDWGEVYTKVLGSEAFVAYHFLEREI